MKKLFFILLTTFLGMIVPSCSSEAEPFIADQPPVNPQDSVIMMELYSAFHIQDIGDPDLVWVIRHPDYWGGVEFEFDETTGYRYVCGVSITGTPDYIPSSLGKLSHLKRLILNNVPNQGIILPKEIFNCPLEELCLNKSMATSETIPDTVTLPSEIGNVKNTLRRLRIIDTALTHLPAECGHLTNLEECLIVGNNIVGKVPDFFGNFKCEVNLRSNKFTEFNWNLIADGKNIPLCDNNDISNPIPENILTNSDYREIIMKKFLQGWGNWKVREAITKGN